ncbi:GNAT family N-acetyltransferase [Psychromonas ossibalaenae]|uniref:GNAT family N-acetyltransferase n=1 Tax=Psychromonas ossibalaenae TaxID=444922 RepID=UPI00037B3CD0|nr:GNAT family N-acetyltransferase [Psychromonas ossibalaenae]
MKIEYRVNKVISEKQFVDLLDNTSLAERRPIGNSKYIAGMLKNSNLIVSAWVEEELIGIARAMTDFYYCCYISDLAVHEKAQDNGVGKELLQLTTQQVNKDCKLILLSVPQTEDYYPHMGFEVHDRAWVLSSAKQLRN